MTTPAPSRDDAPYWSLPGLYEGVRLSLPLMPGMVVFAAAVGALAAQKGFTLFETVVMSATVFAGAAQLVALQAWPDQLTFATIVALALLTATINLRFVLMAAALRPWLAPLPTWQIYSTLFFLTDGAWLVSMRHRAEGGSDVAILLGAGLTWWVAWVAATIPGFLFGALLGDPGRFGFDLILPIFFAALVVPLWRGGRRAIPWAIAGLVAVSVQALGGGWWCVIAGSIAGCVAGGLIDDGE